MLSQQGGFAMDPLLAQMARLITRGTFGIDTKSLIIMRNAAPAGVMARHLPANRVLSAGIYISSKKRAGTPSSVVKLPF